MSETTSIEWCDATINLWWGCTKVSPGCANCYADAWAGRWGKEIWGKGKEREYHGKGAYKTALKLQSQSAAFLRKHGRRPRVFSASMSDWLDPEVPLAWLWDLIHLIRITPGLDWLLLTKRPELFKPRLQALYDTTPKAGMSLDESLTLSRIQIMLSGWDSCTYIHPDNGTDNVWVGTTVEDQKRADERIPKLLEIPAKVRFLSCEPLLEEVELLLHGECSKWACPDCGSLNVNADIHTTDGLAWECPDCKSFEIGEADWVSQIHWVICGGESGPGHRPFNPDWARKLRHECRDSSVPFFMKQMGGNRKPFAPIPEDLMIREFPSTT